MIPRPGEPGDETWAGSPFESRWMTGVWGQLTYDPGARSRLLRIDRRRPGSEAQRKMPGATMAGTNTRFAVRPEDRRGRLEAPGAAARQLGSGMHVRNDDHQHAGESRSAGMLSVNPDARRGRARR